jgi:flagellar biosynthesis protein FlhG
MQGGRDERRLPRSLVVAGGKPGCGATTIAVRLAEALAADAQRVVLVDADREPIGLFAGGLADRCGLTPAHTMTDVLAGRKSIHEALVRGPAGLQVLAGGRPDAKHEPPTRRQIDRLLKQMQSLVPHTDWFLIDAGHRASELSGRLWTACERILLVTSPDAAAVMDTYALVKTLLTRQALSRPMSLVVNQAAGEAAAADVCRRIDQSCRRFLGLGVELAGWLPRDRQLASGDLLSVEAVHWPVDEAIARLCQAITAQLAAAHRVAA